MRRRHRAREQAREIGGAHLPYLPEAAHHPCFVVRYELEGDVGLRLVPAHRVSSSHEPGLPPMEEELARRHPDPLFFDISHSAGSGRPSTLQSSTLSKTWTGRPWSVQLMT